MKRLFVVSRRTDRACRAVGRLRPPARQLHGQPLRGRRAVWAGRVRPLRPRPRRDPDGAGGRQRARHGLRRRGRGPARPRARRPSRGARARETQGLRAAGRGRAPDPALRGCLPRHRPAATRAASCFTTRTSPAGSAGGRSSSEPLTGCASSHADVPAESASDELRAYPRDLLRSPLDVTSAERAVRPRARPGNPTFVHGRVCTGTFGGVVRVAGGTARTSEPA